MLSSLSIQGLALVESVELAFDPGLNVLTGETGAGKSLILGSIGLLLGERADAAWLRAGEERGSVDGAFELEDRPDLVEALLALGVELEDGRLLLRREILPDGKSRAFVNGRPAPASLLKGVGDLLVDLHGQHEHQLLLSPERQADFFDAWAGLLGERRALEEARASLLEERRVLRQARERWERDRADEATVREDFEELRAAAIQPEEEERAKVERTRLQHRGRLLQGIAEARRALAGEEGGAAERLKRAARSIRSLEALDPDTAELAAEADRILDEVGELEARLERREDDLSGEPVDLEALEARLDILHRLKRKHRTDLPGLLALQGALGLKVRDFDPSGRELERAERDHDERLQAFERRLDALMTHRSDRFQAFQDDVGARLSRVGFSRAALRVRATEVDRSRAAIDPATIPTLEFAFRPNPGEAERPLRRIASGGELSRVMLAIKSLMAERDQVAVLVFDEVDQGIGGAAGEEVGRLLRALGDRRQVLCITHLPLIAAFGSRHFEVSKRVRKGRTASSVRSLDPEERELEVARLLAGDRVTQTTRKQARELLEAAGSRRPSPAARTRSAGTKSA
jgi:DNA repair protein RecN (Recombination protein N)